MGMMYVYVVLTLILTCSVCSKITFCVLLLGLLFRGLLWLIVDRKRQKITAENTNKLKIIKYSSGALNGNREEVNYIFVLFPIGLLYQIDCCTVQTVELDGGSQLYLCVIPYNGGQEETIDNY